MSRPYVHEFPGAGRLLTLLSEPIIEGRSFTLDPISRLRASSLQECDDVFFSLAFSGFCTGAQGGQSVVLEETFGKDS